jgi:hypothetical protein
MTNKSGPIEGDWHTSHERLAASIEGAYRERRAAETRQEGGTMYPMRRFRIELATEDRDVTATSYQLANGMYHFYGPPLPGLVTSTPRHSVRAENVLAVYEIDDAPATPTLIMSETDLRALPMGLIVSDARGLRAETYMTPYGADAQFYINGAPIDALYPLTVNAVDNAVRLWSMPDDVRFTDAAGRTWVTCYVNGVSAAVMLPGGKDQGVWVVTEDSNMNLPFPFTFAGYPITDDDTVTTRHMVAHSFDTLWGLPVGLSLTDQGGHTWRTVEHMGATGIQYVEDGQVGEVVYAGNYHAALPVDTSELFPFTVDTFDGPGDLLRLGADVNLRDGDGAMWKTYTGEKAGVGLMPVAPGSDEWHWLNPADPAVLDGGLVYPFTYVP